MSCSERDVEIKSKDWEKELIGVGFIGENPDSLVYPFSYYPQNHQQPGKLKEVFRLNSSISSDTISIPNTFLYNLLSEVKLDNRITGESSTFKITKFESLYLFSKIIGFDFIPEIIYFDKAPNIYPEFLDYTFITGFDLLGRYEIEISKQDDIKVWLSSGAYSKYIFEQYETDHVDKLFINSVLNLSTEKRYDTISNDLFTCGVSFLETSVYNDSLFKYNLNFYRKPSAGILVGYFRSKINDTIHGKDEISTDIECPFDPKYFRNLPVAIKPKIND